MKLVGRADELEKASSLVSQEEDARHVGAWPLAAHLGRSKLGGGNRYDSRNNAAPLSEIQLL